MKINRGMPQQNMSTNSILTGCIGACEEVTLSLEWLLDGMELLSMNGHDVEDERKLINNTLEKYSKLIDKLHLAQDNNRKNNN